MLGNNQFNMRRQMRFKMRKIGVFAPGIDDDHQGAVFIRISRTRHHNIVEHAAFRIEELRVALLAGLEVKDVGRNQRFKRACDRFMIATDQKTLAHMGNIKQARMGARPLMLGKDTLLVLDGHIITRKPHHARAKAHMAIVQRGTTKRGSIGLRLAHQVLRT